MKRYISVVAGTILCLFAVSPPLFAADQSPLLDAMKSELDRSFEALQHANEAPLYYLGYHVTDTKKHVISAVYGAITNEKETRSRIMDTDCRVGEPKLDNTHEIRGDYDFSHSRSNSANLPFEDNDLAIRTIIWKNTDEIYKTALERYTKVKTNQQVLVEREDTSADFSIEKPVVYIGETVAVDLDAEAWKERLKN